MVFWRRKKNPDYAFEKVEKEQVRRETRKTILGAILVAVIVLGLVLGSLLMNGTESSYDTKNPKGELIVVFPESKTEYEIYPTQEFTFNISAHYEIGGATVHYGIATHDKCRIGMFFSDNLLCERISYDTMVLNEDVPIGTEFTVALKYKDELSILEFTVVEKPAE